LFVAVLLLAFLIHKKKMDNRVDIEVDYAQKIVHRQLGLKLRLKSRWYFSPRDVFLKYLLTSYVVRDVIKPLFRRGGGGLYTHAKASFST
jgi:hypothetical protein